MQLFLNKNLTDQFKIYFNRFVLKRDVKEGLTIGLAAILLLAIIFNPKVVVIVSSFLAIVAAVILELAIIYQTKKIRYFPYSAVISSLLVSIILDPVNPVWIFPLAAAIAVGSKYLIGPKQHIFNPAAFGIFTTSVVFAGQISWWAVSWSAWVAPAIILGAGFTVWRVRRLEMVAGFLIVYFIYLLLSLQSFTSSLRSIFDGSLLLFALVMVPEPQTSPIIGIWRKGFGVFVGLVLISGIAVVKNPIADPLIFSLLLADFASFALIKYSFLRQIGPKRAEKN